MSNNKNRPAKLAELREEDPVSKAAAVASEPPRVIRGSPNLANLFDEARKRNKATFLGKGAFGSVRRITRNGRNYALKRVIFNNSVRKNNGIHLTPLKLFESELDVLYRMKNNPSTVHVENAFQTDKNAYILTELLDPSLGFSLENISYHKRIISFRLLQTIVQNLLSGLDSIHEIGYLHLDIKPNNIWIFNDGNIKYLDFGISCKMPCRLENFPGTAGYRKNATPKVGLHYIFDKTNDFHGLAITLQRIAEVFDYDSDESKYLIRIGKELLKLGPEEYAYNALGGAVRPTMLTTRRSEEGGGGAGGEATGGAGGGSIKVNSRPINLRKLRNAIPKTRKVSKNVVRQRAINEGWNKNMINTNILKEYLGAGEAFENEE